MFGRERYRYGGVSSRLAVLENKYVKATWFERVSSGTSGSLSLPTGAEVVLDEWRTGLDALTTKLDPDDSTGYPTFVSAEEANKTLVTATLDSAGNWTISGTPSAYPIGIIYVYRVKFRNFDDTKSIGEVELTAGPMTVDSLEVVNDIVAAGSGRFDGGIAIGTTPAARLLKIYKSTATLGIGLEIDNSGNADVLVRFNLDTVSKFTLGVDNSDSDKFKISEGSTLGTNDALAIDSSGNFDFNSGNFANVGTIGCGVITATGLVVDTTTLVVDAANNRVGIGTTSPSQKLDIVAGNSGVLISDTGEGIGVAKSLFFGDGGGTWTPIMWGVAGASGDAGLHFLAETKIADDSGAEPLIRLNARQIDSTPITTRPILAIENDRNRLVTVDKDGNVGINETSPQDKLEVNGTILVKDKLKFTQDDGNEYIDSLNDGYVDYGATTGHRFNTPIEVSAVGKFQSNVVADAYLTLLLGADVNANTLTDNTRKSCQLGMPHYDIDEQAIALFYGDSSASTNYLNFGGGTGAMNAATHIRFFTAANTTTITGTERMRIESDGTVLVNYNLDVTGNITLDSDANKILLGDGQDFEIYFDGTSAKFEGIAAPADTDGYDIQATGGVGGAKSTVGTGDDGGDFAGTGGIGGAAAQSGAGNNVGGRGGNSTFQAGVGGNASGADGTDTGGVGGRASLQGGKGGGGSDAGGAGGDVLIDAGAGTAKAGPPFTVSAGGDVKINAGASAADPGDIYLGDTTGNVIVGSDIVLPKTSGKGIKIDVATPTFGWRDLLGTVTVKNTGGSRPALITYRDGLLQFEFAAGEEEYFQFHIPHDYVKGTDIFLHYHWSTNGEFVNGGTLTFDYEISYAKGHADGVFPAAVSGTIPSATAGSRYTHEITEVQISAGTPSGSQIDTDDLEPDGVIICTAGLNANNLTVSEGGVPDPFIHYIDIHYQSTNIATKNKVPDFYA